MKVSERVREEIVRNLHSTVLHNIHTYCVVCTGSIIQSPANPTIIMVGPFLPSHRWSWYFGQTSKKIDEERATVQINAVFVRGSTQSKAK
jgi:hypothetical protein